MDLFVLSITCQHLLSRCKRMQSENLFGSDARIFTVGSVYILLYFDQLRQSEMINKFTQPILNLTPHYVVQHCVLPGRGSHYKPPE